MKTQLAYFFKDIFTKSTIQNTKQKYPIKLNNLLVNAAFDIADGLVF
jgi:hypothetical protein